MPPAALMSATASFTPLRVGTPFGASPPDIGSSTPMFTIWPLPPAALLAAGADVADELHAAATSSVVTASAPIRLVCIEVQSPPQKLPLPNGQPAVRGGGASTAGWSAECGGTQSHRPRRPPLVVDG